MTRKEEIKSQAQEKSIERAKKIGMSAWYECVDDILTTKEKEEIKNLWKSMPGNTCWNDAFLKWISLGECPVCGSTNSECVPYCCQSPE